MKFIFPLAAGLAMLGASSFAHAELYDLHYTGFFDTHGQTIYGVSGSAVPYDFRVRLDSDAGEPIKIAAGQTGPYTRIEKDWYGYSENHIQSVSLHFGDKNYVMSELEYNPRNIGGMSELRYAPIWLEGRLGQGVSNAVMSFNTWDWNHYEFSWLHLGSTNYGNGVLGMDSSVQLRKFWSADEWMYDEASSFNNQFSASPAPEAEQYLMLVGGIAVLALRLRRRKTA